MAASSPWRRPIDWKTGESFSSGGRLARPRDLANGTTGFRFACRRRVGSGKRRIFPVLCFPDVLLFHLENKQRTTLLNLTKAFDTVSHLILHTKEIAMVQHINKRNIPQINRDLPHRLRREKNIKKLHLY